ncbi:MAG: hypothetical protein JWM16_6345 [Verrucomicrobiales bacterium]|nr:hypothetical protein [Verrucomicrobiales bacterium]
MAGPSNYPNGFPQGVTIRGVPLTITNPGRVFWVSNATTLQTGDLGGSDGNPGTFQKPLATISKASTLATASRGDIVVVKPGHAETITAAAGIALSKAGVAFIGLGYGSMRPKITWSTANTATLTVSADNISFTNFQFIGSFLSIATAFSLSTAKNFTLQNCPFADAGATTNFLSCITTTGAANTADGLTVTNCSWNGLGTTSVGSFITSANDIDSAVWVGSNVKLARTATAAIFATMSAGVLTNLIATDNVAISQQVADTGGAFINVGGTTSTGVVARNLVGDLSTTDLFMTTNVGVTFDNNKKTGVITASGYLLPATDS